ncbi:hypothetical protein PTKIN_Ptkin14bG0133000 [Pterospermum kingtungense]
MKIVTWNVRGVGSLEKKRAVRRLLSRGKVDMLLLQESKLKEVTPRLSSWLFGNIGFISEFVLSDGNSGGLITCWKDEFFSMESKILSQQFILLIGTIKEVNLRCGICNVYAPNDDGDRLLLWKELSQLIRDSEAGLIDLSLSGGNFTWCSNRSTPTFCRLDRFLVGPEFLLKFSGLVQNLKPKSLSDHNPISLESTSIN